MYPVTAFTVLFMVCLLSRLLIEILQVRCDCLDIAIAELDDAHQLYRRKRIAHLLLGLAPVGGRSEATRAVPLAVEAVTLRAPYSPCRLLKDQLPG